MQLGELCIDFTVVESTSESGRSEANAFLGNPFSMRVRLNELMYVFYRFVTFDTFTINAL
jgi:hypothetical protein